VHHVPLYSLRLVPRSRPMNGLPTRRSAEFRQVRRVNRFWIVIISWSDFEIAPKSSYIHSFPVDFKPLYKTILPGLIPETGYHSFRLNCFWAGHFKAHDDCSLTSCKFGQFLCIVLFFLESISKKCTHVRVISKRSVIPGVKTRIIFQQANDFRVKSDLRIFI
jgi:hypothetical protein